MKGRRVLRKISKNENEEQDNSSEKIKNSSDEKETSPNDVRVKEEENEVSPGGNWTGDAAKENYPKHDKDMREEKTAPSKRNKYRARKTDTSPKMSMVDWRASQRNSNETGNEQNQCEAYERRNNRHDTRKKRKAMSPGYDWRTAVHEPQDGMFS